MLDRNGLVARWFATGVVATLLSAGLAAGFDRVVPASATTPPLDGLTEETAAPSCWSIAQNYPASPDGIYWLRTNTLPQPEQFYCDQTTSGGGWVLIGRGREGWSFPHQGQGSASTLRSIITGPDAFAPNSLPTDTVNGLLNGGRTDALPDGIRVRRASNPTGTSWQEVRFTPIATDDFTWAFGGGIRLSSISFDGAVTNLAPSYYRTNTTANTQISNGTTRIFTYPSSSHNYEAGFSFGNAVNNGSNNSTSYLWEYSFENNAIPFAQVYLRPQISEADLAANATFAPDTGTAATTVRAMPDGLNPATLDAGVTGYSDGAAITTLDSHVTAFAEIGDTIYVGGKFTDVKTGIAGATTSQPYLAAFDRDTGAFLPGFAPVVNGPVWELKSAPDDSKLFVGGEFTSINGQPNTQALAALDPSTGAPLSSWVGSAYRPSGAYDVRAMDIQGTWLYVSGNFTRSVGGVGAQFTGPITNSRLARYRLSDGRPDGGWKPSIESAAQDLDVSDQGDRVYIVGLFRKLGGVTLVPSRFAILDTITGAAVPGLGSYQPNSESEWLNTVLEVGDKVYVGGSQHILDQYDRATFAFERTHETKQGGDFQALAHDTELDLLYGACHCNNWIYQDTKTWTDPQDYTETNPINFIGGFDLTDNMEEVPEFSPTGFDSTGSGGEGPWEMLVDSQHCLWAGGDLLRDGGTAASFYGGFVKFCPRDTTAPTIPSSPQASVAVNNVTLSWGASSDSGIGTVKYEVLRDDPVFGSIVIGSTYTNSFLDTSVVGPTRYFVRAIDQTGNRSASTGVIVVSPPPPAVATIVAAGSTWSYLDTGENLGTTWRSVAYDASSWPTGPAQLGWGDGDEATVVGATPITHYFRHHFQVIDPSIHKTVTVRLLRDDGAVVYVNGIEVVRDNLPLGTVTSSTLAAGFVSGAQETTFYEYSIPGSLLHEGDNVVAVELHQGGASNGDGSFDLELLGRGASEGNAPSTPVVTADGATESTIDLTWSAATDDIGVIGYVVRRDGTTVGFTAATEYTDAGLADDTAYSYEVIAVDSSGNASTPGTLDTTTTPNPYLVRSGDLWRHQSGGPAPAAAWKLPGFDASSWAEGPSQLGWGDGDEATLLTHGTGQITQFFVNAFDVSDPASYPTVTLRVKRDDGVAVYLNGIEVLRDGLPAGALGLTTFSTVSISGAGESTWYEYSLPGALFVAGNNVVAAEVHQNTTNNIDASFDLELRNAVPAEAVAPGEPAVSLAARTDTTASLSWPAVADDTGVAGYVVSRGGVVVGYTRTLGFTDTGLTADTAYSYSVVAHDASGNLSAPGALAVTTKPNATYVGAGSVWSYQSGAPDPGTAWRQPGTDLSAWPTGPAQLGWGDGDEATNVPHGAGQRTQYYVREFTLDDPGAYQGLTVRVMRDDGVAVYLNGIEVVRDGLPTGVLTVNSFATASISGAAESTWYDFAVPAALLRTGDNVVAAEVHQNTSNNADSTFDLQLVANSGTEAVPPSAPDASVSSRTESTVTLGWTAAVDETALLGYVVKRDGVAVGYTTTLAFVDTGLIANTAYSYEVLAVDRSGNTASDTVATSTLPNPNFVNFGEIWRYAFDGVDQGIAWIGTAFDDTSWLLGASELGTGDADEATVIGPAVAPTPITAYFRRSFAVADPGVVSTLTVDLVRDDGAVVYVNGVEAARINMPAGPITYSTRPVVGISDRTDETTAVSVAISPGLLVAGTNVITVEMHQANSSSTDLSFNLRLRATFV